MKKLLFILLITPVVCFGQIGIDSDCGTWETDSVYFTEWDTIDTINYQKSCDDTTWVYSELENIFLDYTHLIYCPCGCGNNTERHQQRISDSGIVQERREVTTYKYVPKPKTEFEKKLDEIRSRKQKVNVGDLDNTLPLNEIINDTMAITTTQSEVLDYEDGALTVDDIIDIIEEYVNYCGRDSILKERWVFIPFGQLNGYGGYDVCKTRKEPIEKPSFIGFYNWLKNK